jgi:hypothetical protein
MRQERLAELPQRTNSIIPFYACGGAYHGIYD